jgi:RHS repeat-associated protein
VNKRDGNRTQNFSYDPLNRIQQAYTNGPNWGETFGSTTAPGGIPAIPGIDAWGNLWQRSPVTGKTNYESFNAPALANNQLTGFGYDAAGNMTSNGTIGYNYDAENHFTKFTGDTTDIYLYDGDGKRVKKNASAVTLYWYDTSGNVLDETNGSGALVSEYIFFNGKRVARRDADSSVKYYFSDHLGSASVVTDNLGVIKSESDYYPFGGEMLITNNDANRYKFTGKERDAESNLDDFDARHYSSTIGRFMQPDPTGGHNEDPQRSIDTAT